MTPSLNFTTDLPGGNACLIAEQLDGDMPVVHFAASPVGGPESMWFYFRIEAAGSAPPAKIQCVLHFIENMLGGVASGDGLHPVFKTGRRDWTRVKQVDIHPQPDNQARIAWTVPGDEGAVEVALTYPYGLTELDTLVRETGGALCREPIGVTQEQRLLPRLRNAPGEAGGTSPGIYCMARQHAGETPGAWVLDGFLRAVAEAGSAAPLVWAVPMADLDGVCNGHYGKDHFPWDFNRAWGSKAFPQALHAQRGTHPMRHEVRCIQTDLCRWRERCRPVLMLDFHAPVLSQRGIFCFVRELDEAGQADPAHQTWIEAIREAIPETMRCEPFARSGRYPGRWNTARVGDFVNEVLGVPQLSLEVPYACSDHHLFLREDYQQAGQRIAQAVMARVQARPADSATAGQA